MNLLNVDIELNYIMTLLNKLKLLKLKKDKKKSEMPSF